MLVFFNVYCGQMNVSEDTSSFVVYTNGYSRKAMILLKIHIVFTGPKFTQADIYLSIYKHLFQKNVSVDIF